NKDDTTKSLLGAPGSNVPAVFELDPKVKRAKRDDGFYAWHITGPLAHLSFQPASDGGGASAQRSRRSPLGGFGRTTPTSRRVPPSTMGPVPQPAEPAPPEESP